MLALFLQDTQGTQGFLGIEMPSGFFIRDWAKMI